MSERIEITVHLDQAFLDRLDRWCRYQPDRPERSAAILRLTDEALTLGEALLRIQAKC